MNVLVSRGAGPEVSIPIDVLRNFVVRENVWLDGRSDRRYRLSAVMSCADLPVGEPFGHSCQHGPPPHVIRVFVRPPTLSRHGCRSLTRIHQLQRDIVRLANASRAGQVVDIA